ncbi:MAG: Ig-like domain-containing protein [Muribaculaceae bacterium]|nr:Ig-like domain-containing protein [Muribaculaceae bacterium]
MKKLLLSVFAALACVATAVADEVTYTFTGEGDAYGLTRTSDSGAAYYMTGTTLTNGASTIEILGSGDSNKEYGNGVRLWTDGLRIMKKSGLIIKAGGVSITNVKITTTKNNGPASFDVNDNQSFTSESDNTKIGTWTGSATEVKLINNGDKGLKGTVCVTEIVVTFEAGATPDTRKAANLKFPEESYTIYFGDPFTAPTLTKDTNAEVTYSSDKETVATVNATTGEVTIVGIGTANITAKAEANDEYLAGSASYKLTVDWKAPDGAIFSFGKTEEVFSFENPEGLNVWSLDKSYGLKGTGYLNGQTNAATAVAYTTDLIDLTAKKNVKLYFSNALNNYKLNNAMIDVADFAGKGYATVVARRQGETTWTHVADITNPTSFSWNFYENDAVSLDAFMGTKIQVGFQYMSTAEVAGTWEVQHVYIMAEDTVGIEDIEAADAEAPVEYYNLQGIRVENPTNGLYIRRQGNKATKVIL